MVFGGRVFLAMICLGVSSDHHRIGLRGMFLDEVWFKVFKHLIPFIK